MPLLVTCCLGLVLLTGCSDSDDQPSADTTPTQPSSSAAPTTPPPDDSADVVDAARSLMLAFNERNGADFVGLLSEAFCVDGFGEPCADLVGHADQIFAGQPAVDIRSLSAPLVEGETATIDLVTRVQSGLHATRVALARSGSGWEVTDLQLDSGAGLSAPNGMTLVDVTMDDDSFDFDAKGLASGVFALRVRNDGAEPHELVIKRIDSSVMLEQALADELPPNVVPAPVASIPPVEPGQESVLVLAEQLPPGHYFIFCELEDEAGTNHLARGMAAEFTVRNDR